MLRNFYTRKMLKNWFSFSVFFCLFCQDKERTASFECVPFFLLECVIVSNYCASVLQSCERTPSVRSLEKFTFEASASELQRLLKRFRSKTPGRSRTVSNSIWCILKVHFQRLFTALFNVCTSVYLDIRSGHWLADKLCASKKETFSGKEIVAIHSKRNFSFRCFLFVYRIMLKSGPIFDIKCLLAIRKYLYAHKTHY